MSAFIHVYSGKSDIGISDVAGILEERKRPRDNRVIIHFVLF